MEGGYARFGRIALGNFRRGGALYSKQGLRMMASTEHADFFTKNLTAVLGELRAVLANELDRSLRGRLKHLGAAERTALEAMVEASLNKMLHTATVRLRDAALERGGLDTDRLERMAQTLCELFALDRDLDLDELEEQAQAEGAASELLESPDSEPVPARAAGARAAR